MPSNPSSNTWNSPQGPAPTTTTSVLIGAAGAALPGSWLKRLAFALACSARHCRGSGAPAHDGSPVRGRSARRARLSLIVRGARHEPCAQLARAPPVLVGDGGERGLHDQAQRQWQGHRGRRRFRHAVAVGAARHARPDRHQVRLRRRAVRQHLSLRHLSAHPRRDSPRRAAQVRRLRMSLDRRAFLKSSACVSGGLIIALHLPGCSKPGRTSGEPKTVAANAWLRIGTDNTITFLCDRSEMGQGVYTALPTLIAEELGVDLGRIRIDFAPAGDAYKNDLLGTQITGGSTSVRDAWPKLRRAGAQARTMLISAAAREWGIRAAVCRVENGFVVSPTGKRASFGACAEAAARLPVPNDVKLTDPGNFRLIGTSVRRLDTPLKVDGSARYGIDVRLPEMLYAALAQPPALGGKAASFDDSKARALPGVKAVVQTSSGIAVVATSWWQALKARDVLAIRWDDGANGALNDGVILRGLERATGTAQSARRDGDADAAIKSAARVVKAEYQLPLLAHATLEPQNCTADVRAEGCDIYVPTQIQQVAQQAAASAAGLKPEQVRVHTTFLGGGFGRRLDVDFVPAAAAASKAVGKPVKLLWTREDDTTHDVYRPPAFDTAIGAFDKSGKLIAWNLRLVGPSVTARLLPAGVV